MWQAWDLAAYTLPDLGLGTATDKDSLKRQMRSFVREVTPATFCLRLLDEVADACVAAEEHSEASFWQIQIDVLAQQIAAANERLEREDEPRPEGE